MITPNERRSLYVAIGVATTACGSDAEAVNLSADNRGQVLIYPYYTTRNDATGNAYATLLSVVNTTGSAKAARVRFLEGKNAREVLNFNLFLSPFDVWTGAVLPDFTTGGAKLGTVDVSCTLPSFSGSPTKPFIAFANTGYSGVNDDGAGAGLDRTKEGYFEIIEIATYSSSSMTGMAVTHVLTSVPPFSQPWCGTPGTPATPGGTNPFPPFNQIPPTPMTPGSPMTDAQAATDAQPPSGGLFGGLTLINVSSGTDYTADATALANFMQSGTNYQPVGSALPNLTQATPPMSAIHGPDGRLYESTWQFGTADAVSAVLMHDSLQNEYVMDTVTKSGTDWVVTMPTKRYYTNTGAGNNPKLFQRNFNGIAGSCDDMFAGVYDREERTTVIPLIPNPGVDPVNRLCWAASVVTFKQESTLGTANGMSPLFFKPPDSTVSLVPFQNGWLNIGFPTSITGAAAGVHKLTNVAATSISGSGKPATTGNSVTYVGLPVIGFAAISFTNGTLQVGTPPVTVLSNYGGNFMHKFNTTIQ